VKQRGGARKGTEDTNGERNSGNGGTKRKEKKRSATNATENQRYISKRRAEGPKDSDYIT